MNASIRHNDYNNYNSIQLSTFHFTSNKIRTLIKVLLFTHGCYQLFLEVWIVIFSYYFHKMIISLDNFDEHGRSKPILNSPRSIQACRRQGIEPEELIIKTIEEIKHIYKDGMKDKKSLEIKMQHHEMRRKNKLDVVRKERIDIINNIRPVYRPNHSSRRQKVEIIEVEDKLEKKRIMDEVKAQLKQKQLQMKQMKITNKINKLQQQKKEAKLKKEIEKIEFEKRAEHNLIKNDILHQTKINNYLFTEMQKQQKIQQALQNKKQLVEQIKRQKQEFYDKKSKYVKELENKTMQEKRLKVESKFNELDQRLQEKQQRDQMYRKNLEQEKRKDAIWKQTKLKQAEIDEKKRQSQLVEAMMHKEMKKQEYIEEIENKKERYYNTKKQDREQKSQLVKAKMFEDQKQIEKRRRIMELIEQEQRKQQELKRMNEKIEMQGRRQELIAKEKQRIQKLKQEQKMKQLNNQFIIEKNKQKLNEIDEKKKKMLEKQKQKVVFKQLKQKQAEENRIRLEKIKEYEKNQQIKKYNEKMNELEEQRKVQRNVKIVKSIDRSSVESKIISQQSLDRNKNRQIRDVSEQRIKAIKVEAKKHPIEVKQALKKQQINKLIDNLKIQCNKEEYVMMKEEQQEERKRQELEKTAENIGELRRLQKIHGVERARFQEKLTALMKQNLDKVERYRTQLLR